MTQVSDIQLWLIDLPWGDGTITAPIYAVKCTGTLDGYRWVLWPAMRFSATVQRSVEKYMASQPAVKFGGKWVVKDEAFPIGMVKADGVTPSFYLATDKDRKEKDPEEVPDEFVREVFEASGIADYALFKAVWFAIIGAIPRWLVRTMRPIDFGYFKVYAIPYRANWKTNLIAAFPAIRSVRALSGRRTMMAILPALRSALFSSRNIETHGEDGATLFGWNIEVIPTKKFELFSIAMEASRRKTCSGDAYVKQWGAIVGRLQSHIEDILFYAARKMALPAAAIRGVHGEDRPGFRPLIETGTLRPEDVDRTDLPVVVNPSGTHVTDGSGNAIEVESFVPVQTVSFVRRKH